MTTVEQLIQSIGHPERAQKNRAFGERYSERLARIENNYYLDMALTVILQAFPDIDDAGRLFLKNHDGSMIWVHIGGMTSAEYMHLISTLKEYLSANNMLEEVPINQTHVYVLTLFFSRMFRDSPEPNFNNPFRFFDQVEAHFSS